MNLKKKKDMGIKNIIYRFMPPYNIPYNNICRANGSRVCERKCV